MSRSREKGWERKRKGKGVEQEQEQGQGQRREQGREPGREPGQEQAGQAAGGGLFVCARKGAGDHRMRGGWGPSSYLVLAVKGCWCAVCCVGFVLTCGPSCDRGFVTLASHGSCVVV